MKNEPNIFHYATSELSQDAFILWLIEWSSPKYKEANKSMHNIATRFVHLIIGTNISISKIQTYKQYLNIDVLAVINDEICILIEDKINTKNHSNQLERYKDNIQKLWPKIKLVCIYYKMENQSNYADIEKCGYKIINRNIILDFFRNEFKGKQKEELYPILKQYYLKLEEIETATNKFHDYKFDDWRYDAYAWQGFYTYLQKNKLEGNWNYVSNPSGGFWSFNWGWLDLHSNETDWGIFLQVESDKRALFFKLYVSKKEKHIRSSMREIYREKLFALAHENNIKLTQTKRTTGETVSVAKIDFFIIQDNGKIDLEKTVNELKKINKWYAIVQKTLKAI